MSYKCYRQGDIPSAQAKTTEMTDYWEMECLLSQDALFSVTQGEIEDGFVEEETEEEQLDGIDTFTESRQQKGFLGMEDRKSYIAQKYPFTPYNNGITMKVDTPELVRDIYSFLLLATRTDMNQMKMQEGVDGTALFERLCNEVLHNYFGAFSSSFVFGTGGLASGGFSRSLQAMAERLEEPGMEPIEDIHQEKDGGVDVVVNLLFHDKRGGSFSCLAQCKTGTNWQGGLHQLNPDSFCKRFFSPKQPRFEPIKAFMIAECIHAEDWDKHSYDVKGLLFDRMRIMQYLPEMIPAQLLTDIRRWNASVIRQLSSPF